MINFFRKTRKQFADDNKPLKYMRYAIGEIVLVVIGILIALSINNWNEARKTLESEKQLYGNIIDDLSSDYLLNFDLLNKLKHRQELHLKFYNESIAKITTPKGPFSSDFLEPTELISAIWENHRMSIESISNKEVRSSLNLYFRDYQILVANVQTLNEAIYNDIRKFTREKEIINYKVVFESSPDQDDINKLEFINEDRLIEVFGTLEFNSIIVELFLATQDVIQSLKQLLKANELLQTELNNSNN